jgi:sulfur-oxidizing protein SoxY
MAACGLGLLALAAAPHKARADPADVQAAMQRLFGERTIAAGRIKLDLPPIAENSLMSPLKIEVDSPMTAEDYVRSVHVFADGNPSPQVVTYHFTPASGRAAATARIRLARSQTVIAVAEMSGGALYMAKAQVEVKVGGCGN